MAIHEKPRPQTENDSVFSVFINKHRFAGFEMNNKDMFETYEFNILKLLEFDNCYVANVPIFFKDNIKYSLSPNEIMSDNDILYYLSRGKNVVILYGLGIENERYMYRAKLI